MVVNHARSGDKQANKQSEKETVTVNSPKHALIWCIQLLCLHVVVCVCVPRWFACHWSTRQSTVFIIVVVLSCVLQLLYVRDHLEGINWKESQSATGENSSYRERMAPTWYTVLRQTAKTAVVQEWRIQEDENEEDEEADEKTEDGKGDALPRYTWLSDCRRQLLLPLALCISPHSPHSQLQAQFLFLLLSLTHYTSAVLLLLMPLLMHCLRLTLSVSPTWRRTPNTLCCPPPQRTTHR